jgi:hypothetical protein
VVEEQVAERILINKMQLRGEYVDKEDRKILGNTDCTKDEVLYRSKC